jgi:hydroxylamine reductase
MFCYQCEQTAKGTGCTAFGVCGKDPEVAALQDLLIHVTAEVSQFAHRAWALGASDRAINVFVVEALFTTVTNVNFDPKRMETLLHRAYEIKDRARKLYEESAAKAGREPEKLRCDLVRQPGELDLNALVRLGEQCSPEADIEKFGATVGGLKWLVIYGLKGTAAYADHALILGREDDSVYAFFHEVLDGITDPAPTVEKMLGLAMKVGEKNLRVMELLDEANTETYGHPTPTKVRVTPRRGKAILVSGHDLLDLQDLLVQTEGKGIDIYTHGEMLPAHGYPELKKFPHLIGNYGGAWQDQQKEFDAFPGAILMTTNCIQKPKESYKARIFTTGLVAWPGVVHVSRADFSPLIETALAAPGFAEDGPDREILVGFARNAVLSAAGKVTELVKAGKIRHFFLVGGCDGAKSGRNYYTDFAEKAPKDTVILTLACGKYRFNKLEFGDIEGIPRLLDCGQCNDAYSAIRIALALADAFKTDVNGLPLSLILSWYEQKAVCILLTLLFLGIRNIRLGPSLPAFLTPDVIGVLQEKFNIMPIGASAEEDLKAILG